LDPNLAEVDFFDLNDRKQRVSEAETGSRGEPSGVPHSSRLSSSPDGSSMATTSPQASESPSVPEQPPNPITAQPGESTDLPSYDEELSQVAEDKGVGDGALPKVRPGEGEGPEVVYGKDVVLDMAGYHSTATVHSPTRSTALKAQPDEVTQKAINTLVDQFAVDLLASTSRPAFLPKRVTETNIARVSTAKESVRDEKPVTPTSARKRFDRGLSEPPPDPDSPQGSPTSRRFTPLKRTPQGTVFPTLHMKGPSTTSLDSRSDKERFPEDDEIDDDLEQSINKLVINDVEERIRADSLPPGGLDTILRSTLPGRLKNVEENPYLFVLEADGGGSHTFELALCGSTTFAPHAEPSVSQYLCSADNQEDEESAFYNNRVTFQAFIEDPQLVDDSRLVIRYSLL
jgi:phosphatidate phosphatase LPIN